MSIDDLCSLEKLDEDLIIKTLQERYESDYNYTYIDDILISVNPYKEVQLNSDEVSLRCKKEENLAATYPHVFGIVNNIHECLNVNLERQCFIVSGESGSGKTELVKLAYRHFLSLGPLNDSSYMVKLQQINTIWDAFGNATTILNDNATRFCKLIKLHFSNRLQVCGVTCTEYLLEHSRICKLHPDERNFHVFYYLFSGRTEDELSRHLLHSPSEHRYLNYGKGFDDTVSTWSNAYKELANAFLSIGFTIEEMNEIFSVLSAILHIGDVKFKCEDPATGVFIENMEVLDKVSVLLGIDTSDLELCLTCNMVSKNSDNVSGFKSDPEACKARDCLGKFLYSRLFSYIICRINNLLNPEYTKKGCLDDIYVCFLDTFGFEDVQSNSLEQLYINTTNEQIALHFTQHVFALEQVEYQQEEVKGLEVFEYFDNKSIINLLLEIPRGIFSLLEEESKCLQADDQTLVSSLNAQCSENKHYIPCNSKASAFSIVHYTKKVTYCADDLLTKNNDKLDGMLIECLRGSRSKVVSTIFNSTNTKTGSLILKEGSGSQYCSSGDLRELYQERVNERLRKEAACNTNKASHNTRSKQKTLTARKHKNSLTTAAYFRNSLVDLMEKILQCQAHFVRCIKPNKTKQADYFDEDFVRAQVKCNGIIDTVKIRMRGYPIRLSFKVFLDRYRFISFNASSPLEHNTHNCEKVLKDCKLSGYLFGTTKVFLQQRHIKILTSRLKQLVGKVTTTQKMVRGRLARIDCQFLQAEKKQEERNLGNLLVSIASRSNKMHDNLLILNQADMKRHERIKEKEMKKKDGEKENQFHRRKFTSATDPDSDSLRIKDDRLGGSLQHDVANRRVPRNKPRTGGEPIIRNFTSSPQAAWCRVDCYERQHHIASFQMEEAVICVDGTHPFSDKSRIAFAALKGRADDPKVAKVKGCIGKGVQLHQDERQNLWATRLGKNPIFVRGHTLCPELVKLNGKLTQGVPMKVLDTAAFKDYMREEVDSNGGVSEEVKERIMSKLKICMSFIKDTAIDEETPCWFEIWLLKVKDQVKRYLENQQKREKRKSGHLDMRILTSQDSNKRPTQMPEMRRTKSGDHIRTDRRPRSSTTNPPNATSDSPTNKMPRSRPPSQHLSHSSHQHIAEKSLSRHHHQQQFEMKYTQDMLRREKSMDIIRREKSMDVRVESRMLMEREYRQNIGGRPLQQPDKNQVKRVRNTNSPGQSPPHSLMRSSGSTGTKRDSSYDSNSPRISNGSNTPMIPHDGEMRRGNSVTAAKEGMSYRQVFGLQSSHLFNVAPPNYTRHRRFSDSDTESLHNFNFIHKVLPTPNQPQTQNPVPAVPGRQSPQTQQEDSKGNMKKWMKKVRRKSEDNPKRKVTAQNSNK